MTDTDPTFEVCARRFAQTARQFRVANRSLSKRSTVLGRVSSWIETCRTAVAISQGKAYATGWSTLNLAAIWQQARSEEAEQFISQVRLTRKYFAAEQIQLLGVAARENKLARARELCEMPDDKARRLLHFYHLAEAARKGRRVMSCDIAATMDTLSRELPGELAWWREINSATGTVSLTQRPAPTESIH